MRTGIRWIILALVAVSATCAWPATARDWFDIRTYSAMGFIRLELETAGTEIAIIPYNVDGNRDVQEKVLLRTAGPFLNPPILLDATETGKPPLSFQVPDGLDVPAGTWTITEKKNSAVLKDSRGYSETLKRKRQ